MLLYVRALTGKVTALDVAKDAAVDDVKAMIHKFEGVPPTEVRLIHQGLGREIASGRTLSDYGVTTDGTTLHLVLRLRGGMHVDSRRRAGFGVSVVPPSSNRILWGDDSGSSADEDVADTAASAIATAAVCRSRSMTPAVAEVPLDPEEFSRALASLFESQTVVAAESPPAVPCPGSLS